jgi:hypothetical protein
MDRLSQMGGKVRPVKPANPRHRLRYDWRVHAQQDVLAFLEAIAPYLVIKRELAERVIGEIGQHPYRMEMLLQPFRVFQ